MASFCSDVGSEVKAGFWQPGPSVQLGDLGVHEMPFPREGRAEAAAPRDLRRGKALMETQPHLGPAQSPPGNPNFFTGRKEKV